jgi:hypothetical protein
LHADHPATLTMPQSGWPLPVFGFRVGR